MRSADPEGERFLGALPWPVDTPGGRYFAEFDDQAPVTREGQLLFFAQFLHAGGRWERFVSNTPLDYVGNRGSAVVDVLGTVTLSILCGHWRYAHINSVRGDRLNPPLLNMSGTVSEDVVRRAMSRIEESAGMEWLSGELRACVEPVLSQPWILDIDVTIKPIYGRQQGAELGHNPHKPGRPSHAYHSFNGQYSALPWSGGPPAAKNMRPAMRCRDFGSCWISCRAPSGRRCCVAIAATAMKCC